MQHVTHLDALADPYDKDWGASWGDCIRLLVAPQVSHTTYRGLTQGTEACVLKPFVGMLERAQAENQTRLSKNQGYGVGELSWGLSWAVSTFLPYNTHF